MAFFMKRWVLLVFSVFVVSELSEHEDSFESMFNFMIGLRNESDTFRNYAAKIQALLCPDQPTCNFDNEWNRTEILRALPEHIKLGTDVIQMEDLHAAIGVCCLSCSCDTETCTENDNCCFSKVLSETRSYVNTDDGANQSPDAFNDMMDFSSNPDAKNTATQMHSDCIPATRKSYIDPNLEPLGIPRYFMITQCFENETNEISVRRCENPSGDEIKDTLPVTSQVTGRVYWNVHCARCNKDESDLLFWNSSISFDFEIAFFVNKSIISEYDHVFPETLDTFLDYIYKVGHVAFTPPFPMEDILCLRKKEQKTCTKHITKMTVIPWLNEACEQFHSPILIENFLGRQYPYRNVFCYLCQKRYIKPTDNRQCGSIHHDKSFEGKLFALIDYEAIGGSQGDLTTASKDENCRCDEMLDPYLVSISREHLCAKVYQSLHITNSKMGDPWGWY